MLESHSFHEQIRAEVKGQVAQADSAVKNLTEAVKQGALRYEQVGRENNGLEETSRRLERLHPNALRSPGHDAGLS